jgi:ABC-2 type transport system permease protein
MSILLTLIRKDIATFLRNRTAVSLTFFVPIALIYIFGQVFGINRHESGPVGIRLAVVNASHDPAAEKLLTALNAEAAFRLVTTQADGTALTEADARRMIHDRELRFAVVLPADLVSSDRVGVHLKILSNPQNEIETQTVNGLLQKAIFAHVPELIGQSLQARAKQFIGADRLNRFNAVMAENVATNFGGDPEKIRRAMEAGDFGVSVFTTDSKSGPRTSNPTNAAESPAVGPQGAAAEKKTADLMNDLVAIDREQVVGKQVKNKLATTVVGGWAIMFLLFAITGSSAAFFDEKNTGIFQRLLSAPVTRGQLLGARFGFGILLGLVQLVAMFSAGSLMYGIDVIGHWGNLVIICVASAAACTSFGMLIAAFSPNAQAASGVATFVVMVMSATGGAWFPISLMPEFMQRVGKLTIVYWSMEGFSAVLWAGSTLRELAPIVGVLLGIATAVMAISVWRLNRRPLFG